MLIRILKRVSHKLAVTLFTLLEILGLPREARERSGRKETGA